MLAKRANRSFIKFNNHVLLNSILSDANTPKFTKQIQTLTETSLPWQKMETSRRLYKKIKTARRT